MEHSYIEDHHIADHYQSGKLSAEERILFEEHFVDCPECLEKLRTISDFCAGLRMVAAEEVARSRISFLIGRAGLWARYSRFFRRQQALLLAILILLITLPLVFLMPEWRRAPRDPAKQMQAREPQRSPQLDQLPTPLPPGQQTPDSSTPPSRRAAASKTSMPVFALSAVRGGSIDPSQPTNRIKLPPTAKSVILLLELDSDPDLQSYRATLSTAAGQQIWSRENLPPSSKGKLGLSIDFGLLKPGNYLLAVEGRTDQEGYALIAKYSFQALISK